MHNSYSNCTVYAGSNCSGPFFLYIEVRDIAGKFNNFLASFYTIKDIQGYMFFSHNKAENFSGMKKLDISILLGAKTV